MSALSIKVVIWPCVVAVGGYFLSFLAWHFPAFGTFATLVIGVCIVVLYLRSPVLALSLVIAELAMGGFGWWLRFDVLGIELSVRMVLFMAVMAGWGVRVGIGNIRSPRTIFSASRSSDPDALPPKKSPRLASYQPLLLPRYVRHSLVVLGGMVIWGMGWGLGRGNPFEQVLLDANGWWYGLLVLPLLSLVREDNGDEENPEAKPSVRYGASRGKWGNMGMVLGCAVGASVATSLLTLFLYHLFMKDYDIAPTVYQWIRDRRLGELTPLFPRGWRVFMQSQVWALVALGWGISQSLIINHYSQSQRRGVLQYAPTMIVITSSLTALILSLSRSYWIGLVVVLATLFYSFYRINRSSGVGAGLASAPTGGAHARRAPTIGFLRPLVVLAVCSIASFGLIYAAQFTPAVGGAGLPLTQRLSISEPAGSSRMNQLKPLLQGIAKHPIIGSGFGTTITYTSADPRIVASTAGKSGQYSTYALEWGYLDMWLKIGLVGVIGYIWLIVEIVRWLWRIALTQCRGDHRSPAGEHCSPRQTDGTSCSCVLAFLSSLVALAFVNVTSPYLNHPLGIGIVLLSLVYASSVSSHRHV